MNPEILELAERLGLDIPSDPAFWESETELLNDLKEMEQELQSLTEILEDELRENKNVKMV